MEQKLVHLEQNYMNSWNKNHTCGTIYTNSEQNKYAYRTNNTYSWDKYVYTRSKLYELQQYRYMHLREII